MVFVYSCRKGDNHLINGVRLRQVSEPQQNAMIQSLSEAQAGRCDDGQMCRCYRVSGP